MLVNAEVRTVVTSGDEGPPASAASTVEARVRCATGAGPLRVAVVHGSEIIWHGLVAMLAPYRNRVHVVQPREALLPVDVTLVDVADHRNVDTDALAQVLDDPAAGAVVILAWELPTALVRRLLQVGCRGWVSKSASGEELVAALERVARGDIVVSPHLDPNTAAGTAGMWVGPDGTLSQREVEVLSMVARGLTNVEIADTLYVSINTVKSYIRSSYRKIGAQRRSQAVRWAIEQGIHH